MNAILQPAFWDVPFESLSWEQHRNFIIRRILQVGNQEMVGWLRSEIGDEALRTWLIKHEGYGLSPRQLHYWKTILRISPSVITRWVSLSKNNVWNYRYAHRVSDSKSG